MRRRTRCLDQELAHGRATLRASFASPPQPSYCPTTELTMIRNIDDPNVSGRLELDLFVELSNLCFPRISVHRV